MRNLRSPKVVVVLNKTWVSDGCDLRPTTEAVFHFGLSETWAGTYGLAEKNNYTVLGGTCRTAGIAGWLHGGGHSHLTLGYVMGVDNVRQVEIVTPGGEVKIANECQNADLYFAVRGGRDGTFNVITNIIYKTLPKFEIQV